MGFRVAAAYIFLSLLMLSVPAGLIHDGISGWCFICLFLLASSLCTCQVFCEERPRGLAAVPTGSAAVRTAMPFEHTNRAGLGVRICMLQQVSACLRLEDTETHVPDVYTSVKQIITRFPVLNEHMHSIKVDGFKPFSPRELIQMALSTDEFKG